VGQIVHISNGIHFPQTLSIVEIGKQITGFDTGIVSQIPAKSKMHFLPSLTQKPAGKTGGFSICTYFFMDALTIRMISSEAFTGLAISCLVHTTAQRPQELHLS
jgi:hypothetical protein